LKYSGEPGQVIPLLQEAQETYGFISPRIMHEISRFTGVPVSQIYGVTTFYAQFRLTPVGEHIIRVCHGTACHVANANAISGAIEDELNVHNGETTPDGKFTLELVSCLGCCSLAPVIMVDDDTHARLTPQKARDVIKQY
jgi:NADH:ubiquinone oxidoreductase subunit E